MSDIEINIYGGNNQILPNADKAEQHFYGDKFAEGTLKSKESQSAIIPPEQVRLSHYINKVEKMPYYINKLSVCTDAHTLAQVVMEMVSDSDVKVDKEEMVKERFINTLLPLASKVTTGISNIRQRINDEYDRQRKIK